MTMSNGGSGPIEKPDPLGLADGPPDQNPSYLDAKSAALRLLAYRGRSEAEVRRRLNPRYNAEVIDLVIANLVQQGYLDDAAFARQWRTNRERRRPRGKSLLRHELIGMGISEETVREALEDFDGPGNAYRAGQSLALRLAGAGFTQFRQRLWAHLQRRGFDGAVIGETVQTLWQELADPLNGGVHTETDEEQTEYTE